MAFNKAPSSWLTGYTYTSDQISFSLSGDYTAECQDAMGLIFRVTDEILNKYTSKTPSERPVQWESSCLITQPTQANPSSLKTITNKFVLDAELFSGLAIPSLDVTISTPDMVYTGFAYGAVSHTAPSGSSVTITYSADGGQTFSGTAPAARGSYIARIVATKDGRSGTARSSFSILKSTPAVIAGNDITEEYSSGTINTNFYSIANFVSITSSNPTVVSVVSFTTGGGVVLQKNSIGQADIIAYTEETSDNYPSSGSKAVILTAKPALINAPATLAISASNGLSQALEFTPNFTLTPIRYSLLEITSSNTAVATIQKGSAYPPTINIITGGACEIAIAFPGDSEYGSVTSLTALTVSGITPVQEVAIAKASSQALFSGDDGIVITQPTSPATGPWGSNKLWTIRIGLDSDQNNEVDGQIPTLPYVFEIAITDAIGQQGSTGATSTTFTNYATNNWISFSISGEKIIATVTSAPSSPNNGEISGGALFVTKAPAGGVLAWTAQFDINVYVNGPRLALYQSGFYGEAGIDPEKEISSTSLTLNTQAQGEPFLSQWDSGEEHAVRMKVIGAGGAPTNKSASIALLDQYGEAYSGDSVYLNFGSNSISVEQNTYFYLFIKAPLTFMISISLQSSTPTYSKVFTIVVSQLSPSMTLQILPESSGQDSHICCDTNGCPDLSLIANVQEYPPLITQIVPETLAWSGSASRLGVTFSSSKVSTTGERVKISGGKTKFNIKATGDSYLTMTLSTPSGESYKSFSITKSIRVKKPILKGEYRSTKKMFSDYLQGQNPIYQTSEHVVGPIGAGTGYGAMGVYDQVPSRTSVYSAFPESGIVGYDSTDVYTYAGPPVYLASIDLYGFSCLSDLDANRRSYISSQLPEIPIIAKTLPTLYSQYGSYGYSPNSTPPEDVDSTTGHTLETIYMGTSPEYGIFYGNKQTTRTNDPKWGGYGNWLLSQQEAIKTAHRGSGGRYYSAYTGFDQLVGFGVGGVYIGFDPTSAILPSRLMNTVKDIRFHLSTLNAEIVYNMFVPRNGRIADGTTRLNSVAGPYNTTETSPYGPYTYWIGENSDVQLYTSPDFPYQNGTVSDYFQITGPTKTLTFRSEASMPNGFRLGDDEFTGNYFGSQYWQDGDSVEVVNISTGA